MTNNYNEPMIAILATVGLPSAMIMGLSVGGFLGMVAKKRVCLFCGKAFDGPYFIYLIFKTIFSAWGTWALGVFAFSKKAEKRFLNCPQCNGPMQVIIQDAMKYSGLALFFVFISVMILMGLIPKPLLQQLETSSMEWQLGIAGGSFCFLCGIFFGFFLYCFLPVSKKEDS
jgi:hypothetical protein